MLEIVRINVKAPCRSGIIRFCLCGSIIIGFIYPLYTGFHFDILISYKPMSCHFTLTAQSVRFYSQIRHVCLCTHMKLIFKCLFTQIMIFCNQMMCIWSIEYIYPTLISLKVIRPSHRGFKFCWGFFFFSHPHPHPYLGVGWGVGIVF